MARVWVGPADDVDDVLLAELEMELLEVDFDCEDVLDCEALELPVEDIVVDNTLELILEDTEELLIDELEELATGFVPFFT